MSSALRNLYLFRVAFSAVWVALASTATPSTHSRDTVSILAGLLPRRFATETLRVVAQSG